MAAGAPDALGVTLRAMLGATYVHVAIVILFLTLLAAASTPFFGNARIARC